MTNPDYVGFTPDQVVEDFKKRIQHYADAYETIDEAKEPNLSFLKIFNAGQKVRFNVSIAVYEWMSLFS